uniref:hypothetical protein n=1 Tax=Prevotella sp. TaxID=59823 RepID=UPI004028D672
MTYSEDTLTQIEQYASIYLKISDMAVILGVPPRICAVTSLTEVPPFRSVTTVARLLHVSSYCIRRCSSPTSALLSLLKTLVTTSSIWRMMNNSKFSSCHN